MNRRILLYTSMISMLCLFVPQVHAQLGKITIDMQKDKPEKFKNKKLKSEKTGEKKFTLPRRFIQNSVSHYNYYFNANNKINSVIERARIATKDDYSKLIPFYSYSLKNTAAQGSELDSVILKATAGILLHDLRSDWVDNFYLLIGKAYYLRQDFDSANMTFQFINYSLAPRKKKSEDDLVTVGSNDNASEGGLSISTKEDRNFIDKTLSKPPSRNDALVWQIRNYIDMEQYPDAAGLINTLNNDPKFPSRLDPFLNEVKGYWFFQQKMYDSSANYIEKSLQNSLDLSDKARREYLLAQLYEMSGNLDTASNYYDKAIKHTTDPLMDIYANLNKAKMLKSDDPQEIINSINRLVRMSKKDKFELYRDIIFYSAAQLALEIPDTSSAIAFFKSSNHFNETNIDYKNQSFLKLAELSYLQKDYKNAYNFYDSLQAGDSSLGDMSKILERKKALAQIVTHIDIIQREDSLQSIAAMTNADRDNFIKKLSKKLRKERGLSDAEYEPGNAASTYFENKNRPTNIFGNEQAKGDWYFYNNSVKVKGLAEFKKIWGKRENVDNWRRISSGERSTLSNARNRNSKDNEPGTLASGDIDPLSPDALPGQENVTAPPDINFQEDISVDALTANVPLTPVQMDTSNSRVATSLFQLGKNYQNLLVDYYAAIETYEKSLNRFPDSLYGGELYMNLSYCYSKVGDQAKADHYKNIVLARYGNSHFAQMILHPEKFNPTKKDTAVTNRYTGIYNLFIEGKFEEAIAEKNAADSLYGTNYWSPQLFYIEAVYNVRQRDDSAAIISLNKIMSEYPTSPLSGKAAIMIDVLNRRDSIENYLTNLKVERVKEDSEVVVFDDTKVSKEIAKPKISTEVKPVITPVKPETATINPEKKLPAAIKNASFTFDASQAQNVIMVLEKVDPVYAGEARNAFVRYNREKFYQLDLKTEKDTLDVNRTLIVFSSFLSGDEAIKYLDKIRKDAVSEVSWLPANKYSFLIISDSNLQLLKENKNLADYIKLLNEKYPGKF